MKDPKWAGLPIPDAENCALAKRRIGGKTVSALARELDRSPTAIAIRLRRFVHKYGMQDKPGSPSLAALQEAVAAFESPTDDLPAKIRRLPGWVQRRLANAGIRTREDILHLGRYGFLQWGSFGAKSTDLVGSLIGGWPEEAPPKVDLKAVPTEQLVRELRRRKVLRPLTFRDVLVKNERGEG